MVKKWIPVTIGDIASFQGGSQPPLFTFSSSEKKNYVRLIQIRDYKTDKYLTFAPVHLCKRFCTKEDVMIGRYGPPIFQILRGLEGAYNVALIKAIPHHVSTAYLFYTLKRKDIFSFVELLSRRSSGQTGVDLASLKQFEIAIPSDPDEQKAIAEALSDIDRLITATEKLIDKKKAIKQSLMQKLLTGKYRLPGFTKPWVKVELGKLCKICKGTQINKNALKSQGQYYVMNGGVEPSGYTDSWNTPENTISISEGGNSCGFVQFNKTKFWSGGHCYTLECNNSIDLLFLYQWLKNAQSLIMKLRIGTGLPNIQRESLEKFSCFIPSDDHEQKKISKIFFDFDLVIGNLENTLSKCLKIKQGMMSELLTGRIRLKQEK